MEKKKKNRVIIGIGITTLTVIGGIILYKKCPKVKEVVNLGISKLVSSCKNINKETTTTETTTSKFPDFKIKPRTYKTYNGKKI